MVLTVLESDFTQNVNRVYLLTTFNQLSNYSLPHLPFIFRILSLSFLRFSLSYSALTSSYFQAMYITKIEIDGFKSYGNYQALDNLDTQFNAITGLNGSGKSNILDSICFLLGISHLQYIRAENNEDLVFRKGQSGVTKATVTITFDNRDPKHKPIGYESDNTIVIRRQVSVLKVGGVCWILEINFWGLESRIWFTGVAIDVIYFKGLTKYRSRIHKQLTSPSLLSSHLINHNFRLFLTVNRLTTLMGLRRVPPKSPTCSIPCP